MELHDAIRSVVVEHGDSMLSDATGFRGVLDDVLEERQATTGDINLLVDAVRFDVLSPLVAMIDSGADVSRAVEEAGARLARERGGADQGAASWASAVLGYAVGKVPEALVLRYRSARPSGHLPPPTAAPPAGPTPSQASGGWQPGPGFAPTPPGKKGKGPVVWAAAAVAGVVVVGGIIAGVVVATSGGGKEDPPGPPDTPAVDVDPAAIDERYDALAGSITADASDCEAADPGKDQDEVVECTVNAGKLRLVTYTDQAAAEAAREARLDYRAGTLVADNGSTAFYEFDPERGGTSDPAIVYWDSTTALQSATLTATGSADIDTLGQLYKATTPRVAVPTAPAHPVLREFIKINMDVAGCARQRTFFAGETEESACEADVDGIVVNVGRYSTRKGLVEDRQYYKGKYKEAGTQGGGGTWRFGEGKGEGAYYAYLQDGTAALYWDWNKADCNCYGIAWSFDGDLQKLEEWWPGEGA
ncbi:hypothetical protein L615_007100000050 [Nocardioides sp. J9]|uniref:hypothetical protein n=1 Tax=Nocardioides sp. J9 TaxID=935844 RepID=UPI00119DA7F3|nr:hypothetical protein [Nocardioides sp. J9]TWG92319.1 hypothetical protein L615_007100000050 [Nocardioides sp. J9]